jgi:hypothetical protein
MSKRYEARVIATLSFADSFTAETPEEAVAAIEKEAGTYLTEALDWLADPWEGRWYAFSRNSSKLLMSILVCDPRSPEDDTAPLEANETT